MSDDGLWNGVEREAKTLGRSLLVVFGLNQAVGVGLSLVVAPLLVNEPWNATTMWSLPVTVALVVVLELAGVAPTVRRAWVFGIATFVGFLLCSLVFGAPDARLSGSLYPVIRGVLLYLVVLAFAGLASTVGVDDVRRLAKTER
ncbi:hypothetical protein SAMN04487950_0057 [Halogranum rubrum]|uniref:Uncharacterized protein n=1 Tax=Halogranum rubrum TaxID=553466 RepID=A0A1I4AR18_9EURY|nr:hypothetical protein [Halogranum rubrum]SFK58978.1 hypothetical protein SAMN04487950_0057 [Halogranum rubrum]